MLLAMGKFLLFVNLLLPEFIVTISNIIIVNDSSESSHELIVVSMLNKVDALRRLVQGVSKAEEIK